MAPPSSHCLELCDDGLHYQFRSPRALRALLGLAPPYNTCLAYAPYARNAPHCSRPINRAKAASVPCLLDRLEGAKIPSMAAEGLLKSLSTHAVCGITGWHQNKATEVYSDWQHDLWYECLRVNGLDPRKWSTPAPSMMGWYRGLELARQEQGWETGESDSEDSEVYMSEENEEGDGDDSDEEDGEDSDEESITSLSEGSVTDSDAVSDFDEQEDISFDYDDGDSSSGEIVETPDTTFSGFDEASTDFYPSTPQHSSSSGGHPDTPELSTDSEETPSHGSVPESPTSSYQPGTDASPATDPVNEPSEASAGGSAATPNESEVQDEEDRSPSADEFATHLLAIDDEILQGPTTNGSSASATGIHHPGSPVGFRLYPQAPSPASQLKQLLNLMTQTVSQQRRYAGVLYGFMRPSAPGMLKIGVVKDAVVAQRPFADPVDHRLATWQAQCGHPVVEVFRKPIACAAAERIESLVHLALRQYRRVQDPPCGRCEKRKRAATASGGRRSGGKHDEWFEIDAETAKHVIDLWAAFAEQLPYDRFGRLVDFWSAKVEAAKAHVGLGSTVESWQETIPQLVEERTRTNLAELISRFYF